LAALFLPQAAPPPGAAPKGAGLARAPAVQASARLESVLLYPEVEKGGNHYGSTQGCKEEFET
jgi:hypothetical protein